MKGVIKNVLSSSELEQIFKLYNESSNEVELYGEKLNRHNVSNKLGVFLLSHFTPEEFESFNSKIISSIEKKEGIELDVSYSRVLKYTKGCYIEKHYDIKTSQAQSGISIILQLSNQDEYLGGKAKIEDEEVVLLPGDVLYYTYQYEHEVTKILSGNRYVVNLRAKLKKSNTLI